MFKIFTTLLLLSFSTYLFSLDEIKEKNYGLDDTTIVSSNVYDSLIVINISIDSIQIIDSVNSAGKLNIILFYPNVNLLDRIHLDLYNSTGDLLFSRVMLIKDYLTLNNLNQFKYLSEYFLIYPNMKAEITILTNEQLYLPIKTFQITLL